ncbi:MAG TPA: MFS transporter, partial [Micrococcus luteus]|nr:MFS transporter [Micrococcus luteus]
MDFGAYGRLLQDPRIRHLLAVGFIARFPHTAAGVILTLHVALTLGLGYGQAGLAGAAMTLGIAVGSPWRGRVVDAKGLRRALLPSVIAEAVIWPIVPWLPFWPMLLAVFLGGVFSLPIFSVVRQGLGVLTHGKDRQTAFALDSIVTETIFMMGPALGAVVAATWSSALGLTIVGLSSALG